MLATRFSGTVPVRRTSFWGTVPISRAFSIAVWRTFLTAVWGTVLVATLLAPAVWAESLTNFNQIVVFGDSLSDTGNVAIATGGLFPGPNYAAGRFTNGPNTTPASAAPVGLWVDQLAARLGVPDPQPFLGGGGGTDYAFGSASTGSNGLYNISDQVNYFLLTHAGNASASSLYAIWGGANDLFNSANTPAQAANNLYSNILTLAAAGGKTFLWFDLPPLGSTPRAQLEGNSAALTASTVAFNQAWSAEILLLRSMGIDVVGVDVYGLYGAIAQNPGAYGFTNLTTPAQGLADVNPNTFLFWDAYHPTTAGHAAIANLAYNNLAVPEPVTYAMMFVGLLGLLVIGRVRRLRSAGDRHPAA